MPAKRLDNPARRLLSFTLSADFKSSEEAEQCRKVIHEKIEEILDDKSLLDELDRRCKFKSNVGISFPI